MPVLVVRDGPSAGHRIEVAGGTVLGRADGDFLRHDTGVAGRHAVVRTGAEGLEIEDLGSSSGTYVNDERIEGARPLRSGDVIRLGITTFDVHLEPSPEPTAVPEPGTSLPPPMPAAYGSLHSAPVGYGEPPGSPVYGAPGVAAGARPGAVTAAVIILLTLGIGGMMYNAWDLILLFGDLELANAFGFGGRLMTLIVIDIGLLIAGVLQIVAGIRLFALSRVGRILGIVGSFSVVALWLLSLVLILSWGFVLQAHAWAVLALSVAGSLVAAILLLSSGRRFPSSH
jgi:FHA domain